MEFSNDGGFVDEYGVFWRDKKLETRYKKFFEEMRQLLCDRFGMKMYIFDKLDVHFGGVLIL